MYSGSSFFTVKHSGCDHCDSVHTTGTHADPTISYIEFLTEASKMIQLKCLRYKAVLPVEETQSQSQNSNLNPVLKKFF